MIYTKSFKETDLNPYTGTTEVEVHRFSKSLMGVTNINAEIKRLRSQAAKHCIEKRAEGYSSRVTFYEHHAFFIAIFLETFVIKTSERFRMRLEKENRSKMINSGEIN